MAPDSKLVVLVTGGSGYLGQFLVTSLASAHTVIYTYSTNAPTALPEAATSAKVDLVSGFSLAELFQAYRFDAVVNCAAMSQPGQCEKDADAARAINVPTLLLEQLAAQKQRTGFEALLIHLSTDQVYDGSHAHWMEDDVVLPLNVYGRTKLEAETAIQERWPHHVILRSSAIYGPPPPHPVGRALFLQFMDTALQSGAPTTFMSDEYRCFLYVQDVVEVVSQLLRLQQASPRQPPQHRLYNMGGPQRLSRVDIAQQVAAYRGYDPKCIVPILSASFVRNVASPLDISMCMDRLVQDLKLRLRSVPEALAEIWPAAPVQQAT